MRKILTLILGLIPSIALADPIKLAGITMEMTLEQQKQVLTDAGYNCYEEKTPWGVTYQICEKGKKEVRPSEKKVRINCETFNACSLSYKELAQAIVDQGIIENMEYKPKFIKSLEGGQILIEQYCGRGEEGELVCVEADKNLLGDILLTVTLEKGTLGQGEVKFN